MKNIEKELKYLKILSKQYPSISKASTEIINLEDEEAKEDFADQIGISLKIAKRGIPKSKVR